MKRIYSEGQYEVFVDAQGLFYDQGFGLEFGKITEVNAASVNPNDADRVADELGALGVPVLGKRMGFAL